ALDPGLCAAGLLVQGGSRQEFRPAVRARRLAAAASASWRPDDQPIDAEPLFVEPDAVSQAEPVVDRAIGRRLLLEAIDVDAERPEQPHRLRTVLAGPFDVQRTAVQEQRAPIVGELVALRMA